MCLAYWQHDLLFGGESKLFVGHVGPGHQIDGTDAHPPTGTLPAVPGLWAWLDARGANGTHGRSFLSGTLGCGMPILQRARSDWQVCLEASTIKADTDAPALTDCTLLWLRPFYDMASRLLLTPIMVPWDGVYSNHSAISTPFSPVW